MTEYRNIPTCNMVDGRASYAGGAKAYLLQNGFDRYELLIRSRSGRWIAKWVAADAVTNWRYTTVVPQSSEHKHLWRYEAFSTTWQALPGSEVIRGSAGP